MKKITNWKFLVFMIVIGCIFFSCSNPSGGGPLGVISPETGGTDGLPTDPPEPPEEPPEPPEPPVVERVVDTTTLYMNMESSRNMLSVFQPAFPEMNSVSWPESGVANIDSDNPPAFILVHRGCSSGGFVDVSDFFTPELKAYVEAGGIIITEMNTSNQVYNYFFDTNFPLSADTYGGWHITDIAPTDVQYNSNNPFWREIGFRTPASYGEHSGEGYDISHLPNITKLAGWTSDTVAIGYIDYGSGRIWFLECDWQDGDAYNFEYTAEIMRYMATHNK